MNEMSGTKTGDDRIACQQILAANHSIFSIQQLLLPADPGLTISSPELLRLYLEYIERFTLGIIRVRTTADSIDFCLSLFGVVIIRFGAAQHVAANGIETSTLRISGGVLVQPKECLGGGELVFTVAQHDSGALMSLQLVDYCPLLLGSKRPSLLRKWLYRLTQAYIHKVITIRFLRMVYQQLTGKKLPRGTVPLAVRKGENI
jgi:hypothetical protein